MPDCLSGLTDTARRIIPLHSLADRSRSDYPFGARTRVTSEIHRYSAASVRDGRHTVASNVTAATTEST